jgi:hypothetical protein
MTPSRFKKRMEVRVSYRWRRSVDDDRTHGVIAFRHEVSGRSAFLTPTYKRKPSAAKREEDEQDRIYRIWEMLRRGALHSVHEYLRTRGGGEDIPETYRQRPTSISAA